MKIKNIVASLLISSILTLFTSFAVYAQTSCYTVNVTITNTSNSPIDNIGISFSSGNPFLGTLVVGPQIGVIGPVPANGSASFTLTGSWNQTPDNVVTQNAQGSTYQASISAGCATDTVVETVEVEIPQYQLPGVPLNTSEGFVLLPENTGSTLQIWVLDNDGNGVPGAVFTEEELATLPSNPETNTEVVSGPGFAFYVLTSGELQINYGPTEDGWVDVVVFNRNFEITNQYRFSTIPR